MKIGILFPHQLFEKNGLLSKCDTIYLIEEYLFFKQYNFHKQKIAFHRASMKFYESYLQSKKMNVIYIDSTNKLSDVRNLISSFKSKGIKNFEYIDTTDYLLEKRLTESSKNNNIVPIKNQSQLFLNSSEENASFFEGKKRMFQTDFYKHQRLRKNILLEIDRKPIGGKWTFDDENRLKYPKGKNPPKVDFVKSNDFYTEATIYTNKHFSENYGKINSVFIYPTTFAESKKWLQDFLKTRFD
jgi:deoxyribodipyrimidine photolyase-related protein